MTLDQVLMLVGCLDDSPGFDTPRQRFRRFLTEHVTDIDTARAFIDQCDHAHGQNGRRALQDLMALFGRFLGFETRFGSYEPVAGVLTCHAHWQSRAADIILDVRSDLPDSSDVAVLSRSVAAMGAVSCVPNPYPTAYSRQTTGLCVVTSLRADDSMLEQVVREIKAAGTVRITSYRALAILADMTVAGRLTHEEILQLFDSTLVVDRAVRLVERQPVPVERQPLTVERQPLSVERELQPPRYREGDSRPENREPRHWFVTIDAAGNAESAVESIVRDKRLFSVDSPAISRLIHPGDWLCFCIKGAGVVGHARVTSAVQQPSTDAPAAGRVMQVCHLGQTELYIDKPVVPDLPTRLRLTAAHHSTPDTAPAVLSISGEEFRTLTGREGPPPLERIAARGQSR